MSSLRRLKRLLLRGQKQRSCTKHGTYTGAYCPQCYQKAMNVGDSA